MRYFKIIGIPVLLFLVGFSCTSENTAEEKKEKKPEAEVKKITDSTSFANDVLNYDGVAGVVGVYDVPEMLVLSIMDSAASKDVSAALIKNYAIIEEEVNATGAEINGPIGMITYNNDVRNFTFENVIFIKRIPKIQPKRCKIVVLEASKMLVYNFYGTYQSLFSAYDKIKRYCDKNDLLQSGPMREFYITDPGEEKDSKKWLTRIMVPVISMTSK